MKKRPKQRLSPPPQDAKQRGQIAQVLQFLPRRFAKEQPIRQYVNTVH